MGEVSEAVEDGAICAGCGDAFLDDSPGYPRSCSPECEASSGVPVEDSSVRQWEYLVGSAPTTSADSSDINRVMGVDPAFIQPWLNEQGKEGWELVAIYADGGAPVYFFKRELFFEE